MNDSRVTVWLRSAAAGKCASPARPSTSASCATDDSGRWDLASGRELWTVLARDCLARCAGCARCQHVSLSSAHTHCTWHHSCTLVVDHFHRTGPALPPPSVAAAPLPDLARGAAWLESTITGVCDSFFPHDAGDCTFGGAGKFRMQVVAVAVVVVVVV